ncbi:hypothetical protein H2200_012312 [Cladophialophora chaetospira]|uniref:Uncharacterized protein n=1 Tax=Cladophialophora chaetospira TaxID=386627 RepID=A0AA38WXQ3_9EURO|nr:hypothetical protein H2200_012312 [Cladophialophora chaetospira]
MAEPDDVEEDLFADLYDGDENAASTNNVVPPAQNAPTALATQPTSSDTAMKSNDDPGYGEEPEVGYNDGSFEAETQGQDETSNGNHYGMHSHDAREMQPQQERYNVNMKEDG